MLKPSQPEKVTLEREQKCKNAKHIKRTLKRNIESNQDCLSIRGLLGNSLFATTVDCRRITGAIAAREQLILKGLA
ncbi:MAG: hypothetical protein Q9188_006266 [Gyalolechia gomerana]